MSSLLSFWIAGTFWQVVGREGSRLLLKKGGTKGTKVYALDASAAPVYSVCEFLAGGCRLSSPLVTGRLMMPEHHVDLD